MTLPAPVAVLALVTLLEAGSLPDHPALLAPLTPQSVFPRFTPAELEAAGFPDHKHAAAWPNWTTPVGADCLPFGPGTLVQRREVVPQAGLDIQPGEIRYRGIHLTFVPEWPPIAVMPFVEVLDWARHEVPPLLGHDRPETLRVVNPDGDEDYKARTGQGIWRLYAWQDGVAVVEPVSTLFGRTLETHAAFALVTEWLLDGAAGCRAWPAWLRSGLAAYIAEDGVHLINYANEFRLRGAAILMTPAQVESVLAGAPAADPDLDRQQYRLAVYSAFLMAWELVENRGGLAPVRRLVQAVAAGQDIDTACRNVYGMDLAALAAVLDPTTRPEPLGAAVQPRAPHKPPQNR